MVSGSDGACAVKIARIGLTGGIGSGKSTVASMFAAWGVPVLDLDQVGHKLTEREDVIQRIVACFGDVVIDDDGRLDRRALARLVFADAEVLQRLNRLLHPLIWQYETQWLDGLDAPFAVIEASALIESGSVSRMDAVIVVLADETIRRQRVAARSYPDIALFDDIIRQQVGDEQRIKIADYCIDNNSDLPALKSQAEGVYQALRRHYPLDSDRCSD